MKKGSLILLLMVLVINGCRQREGMVVFQSDFGVKDGAVSAMKGVAMGVDDRLRLFDITHEIPAYNIWEAAYRLQQAAPYWPAGTVFVSVVDPGVGTSRKSIVMKSKTGQYFVTPDNGTLTMIAEQLGIEEVREINEELNRRKNSGQSYTFHGRDVYAYTGARLAAGVISFEEVGNKLADSVVSIPYQRAVLQGDSVKANIPVLDIQYGNIWTNISDSVFKALQIQPGAMLSVKVMKGDSLLFNQQLPFVHTFGEVPAGKPLAYMNSLLNFSLAVNQGSFADQFHISSGPEWKVIVKKAN